MDGHTPGPIIPHPQPEWVKRHPISADQYQRMGELGILPPDARVELIEGELIAMSPMGAPHVFKIMKLNRLLVTALGDRAMLGPQISARLGDYSEPEPDFVVVRPSYTAQAATPPKPEDILLVIEVSDSSLRYDKTRKAALYARYGVPEYWIVDITGPAALIVHRDSKGDAYTSVRHAAPDEVLEPLLLPGLRLPVADLLA